MTQRSLRDDALAIWQAAVDAARPDVLMRRALEDRSSPIWSALHSARRIVVVGGGKAGAAMAATLEDLLPECLDRVEGVLSVPADCVRLLQRIRLHAARPAGVNFPTVEGVEGTRQMLDLVGNAGPEDVVLCLLSGGGSALMPAPVPSVSLEDKQQVTQLLHACGATINEMNAVRKHLSRFKGGRLAQHSRARAIFSLIISDVIGDPLDVIASGPTAPDPSTFGDALAILAKYELTAKVASSVRSYLERGAAGAEPETPKALPDNVVNCVIGNNARSLTAARAEAENLGYRVVNLGSFIQGEAQAAAGVLADVVQSIRVDSQPEAAPVCVLSGGETTVTLGSAPGMGGRNQEFVLSAALRLETDGLSGMAVLSGGTDGEDGPTDAAGAVVDEEIWRRATDLGLDAQAFLDRHDAYHFFDAVGGLIRTGLTQTNVMDVRVMLVG